MKLVIYGAGTEGRRVFEDVGRDKVFCFIDQRKQEKIDGCPVYTLTELPVSNIVMRLQII